jgi:tRNA (guanine37-N1)-methyltransferase
VPDALTSGNHAAIAAWGQAAATEITAARRPDLYAAHIASRTQAH